MEVKLEQEQLTEDLFSLQVAIKYFRALSLTINPTFFLIDILNNTKFKYCPLAILQFFSMI